MNFTFPVSRRNRSSNDATILVVEDSADLAESYTSALEKAGFTVESATNGREATTKFVKKRIDVAILDFEALRYDSYLCGQVLSSKASAKTIILFESKRGSMIREAEQLGIDLFLKKPVPPTRLLKAVNAVIGLRLPCLVVGK